MFKKTKPNNHNATLAVLVLLFVAIIDTTYLAYTKYTASKLVCGVIEGCNRVALSDYSYLFGIPLAYIGLAFYIAMFVSVLALYIIKDKILFYLSFIMSFISFIMSFYFLYLQTFKIEAYCIYCLISAGISIMVFVLFVVNYKNFSHENIISGK